MARIVADFMATGLHVEHRQSVYSLGELVRLLLGSAAHDSGPEWLEFRH